MIRSLAATLLTTVALLAASAGTLKAQPPAAQPPAPQPPPPQPPPAQPPATPPPAPPPATPPPPAQPPATPPPAVQPPPSQPPAAPPADPASKDAPIPEPLKDIVKTPEPEKNPVHGSLTAGFQFLGGVTEAWGGSFDGNISRAYSKQGKLVARGTYNYARVHLSDVPTVDQVQTDRAQLSAGLDQNFSTHGIFQARSSYLRDPVQQIFSRYEELIGVGYHYADPGERVDFVLVPGVSLLRQQTFVAADDEWQAGVGVHEQLSAKIDKVWSIANAFTFRHNLRDKDDSIDESASLTAQFGKGLGLQIQQLYVRESLAPPGVAPYQVTFQVGLQVKF